MILNRIEAVDGAAFGYDANGNLVSQPATVTRSGGARTFVYDVENRLVSSTAAGATTTLRYDPLGRLYEIAGPMHRGWANDDLCDSYRGTSRSRVRVQRA